MHRCRPNMVLITQDKAMSCWYASGQMLIQWRRRTSRMTEMAHPEPSQVKRWSQLYDKDPGKSKQPDSRLRQRLGAQDGATHVSHP